MIATAINTSDKDKHIEELQALLNASLDVICSIGEDDRIINISASCFDLWGYSAEEMINTSVWDYIVKEDREKTAAALSALKPGIILPELENRYYRKDGSVVTVSWKTTYRDERKKITYCVAKDATPKKKAELRNAIQQRRLYRAYRLAGMAWWELDVATQTYTSSFEIFQMFGLPLTVDNKTTVEEFLSVVHPDDLAKCQADLTTLCNETYFRYEHRIVKPSGEIIYVIHYSELIRDENGVAIALHGTTQDITEDKLKERQEKLLQERYRLLFYESPLPKFIFTGSNLQIVEVNDTAIEHYGWLRQEFLKMQIFDLFAEDQKAFAKKICTENRGNRNFRYNGMTKHNIKGGKLIDVDLTFHAFQTEDDIQFVVVASDVTEKLQAQKKLSQTIISTQEKERSVIGKELHDNVNQLLTTAKLYFENADYYPEQRKTFMEKGKSIIQLSINEIRSLSKALITPVLADLDFEDALNELIHHYEELKIFSIELDYQVGEQDLNKDSKLSIYRILQELFNNTIKYANASEVKVHLQVRDEYLRIVYEDNGVGFDPYCPKKGVGIANIKSRVEVQKGKVSFKSAKGQGCKVLIVLPAEKTINT